jgi:hypothetical protein
MAGSAAKAAPPRRATAKNAIFFIHIPQAADCKMLLKNIPHPAEKSTVSNDFPLENNFTT